MRQSNLLILNTVVTFTRMVVSVLLGLLTTRLVLRALGDSDFNVLAVLGATGALLMVISDAISGAAIRHVAYELGTGNRERLRAVTTANTTVFSTLALLTLVIGGAATPLVMKLELPPDRLSAARWVYLATVGGLAMTILATPFRAVFLARQQMVVISVVEFLQTLLKLGAAYAVTVMAGDRLVWFAGLSFVADASMSVAVVVMCLVRVPDSRPVREGMHLHDFWSILTFAGWSILGQAAWRIRAQGAALLLNLAFGKPNAAGEVSATGKAINGAYGLALQLASYQASIVAAISRVASPSLTVRTATGDADNMRRLILLTSKYSVIGSLFYVVPMLFESETFLRLWLQRTPLEHTGAFTRLVMLWIITQNTSIGHILGMVARNKIRGLSILDLSFDCLAICVAAVCFWGFKAGPLAMPWSTLIVLSAQTVFRVWFCGRELGVGLSPWVREVILPSALTAIVPLALCASIHCLMPLGWARLLTSGAVCGLAISVYTWFFGLTEWERDHFGRIAMAMIRKFSGRSARLAGDEVPRA